MMVAGVGGMGVVFLTNVIAEAALLADIPIAASEIHGLSQRRGSVISGITFGEHTCGIVEEAGADYLLGLEPIEAIRCIGYLHRGSRVVIDDNRIYPHTVSAGKTPYPDVDEFAAYLEKHIEQVLVNKDYDQALSPINRNVYVLGKACNLEGFPLSADVIERAVENTAKKKYRDETLTAFRLGAGKRTNKDIQD